VSLARLQRARVARAPERGAAGGRPSVVERFSLTPEQLLGIRQLALKLDLGGDRVSHSLAVRLWAERELAEDHPFRVWLNGRHSKHHLPRSLRDAIWVPSAVVASYRSPKRAERDLSAHAPGTLRPEYAGERESWDDASVNFILWEELDGEIVVGRFQLLLGVDDATDYIVGFGLIARERDAYRGEDVLGRACLPAWRGYGLPERVIFERGIWESTRVCEALAALGVERLTSYHPRTKRVEGVFDSLWTRLGHVRGYVGRDKAVKDEAGDRLLRQCRAGSVDPRTILLSVREGAAAIQEACVALNRERRESKVYGRWVPEERWVKEAPERLRVVPVGLWAARPERRMLTVRRGGMVCARVQTDWGWSVPYDFGAPELSLCVGREVAVYFDPWAEGDAGKVATAVDPASGQVIAERCALLTGDVEATRDLRKQSRLAVRSELRVLAPGGKLAAWRSEARASGGGISAVGSGEQGAESREQRTEGGERRAEGTAALLARLGDRDAELSEFAM
jgi:hypothetical protein